MIGAEWFYGDRCWLRWLRSYQRTQLLPGQGIPWEPHSTTIHQALEERSSKQMHKSRWSIIVHARKNNDRVWQLAPG